MSDDNLTIPDFLKRTKGPRRTVAEQKAVDWAPINKGRRRSAVEEKMIALTVDPQAPVIAVLDDNGIVREQKFKGMVEFIDQFYNEKIHSYLGMQASSERTVVRLDVSKETAMKQRFEDLKLKRHNSASNSKGESEMAKEKKTRKPKPAKPEKKLVTDPRFDGKKLTRILVKDLPEGTKALKKESPLWGAYIYVARKPGVKFEDYANVAKHSVSHLADLVERGHVVAK